MPGIAFTYEMDGQTTVHVFGQAYPIPGPDNPTDQCPFCGPSLPNNITRLMRKGYYLAVTWIDYLVGQIVGELETLGHKDDTVIAVVGDHVSEQPIGLASSVGFLWLTKGGFVVCRDGNSGSTTSCAQNPALIWPAVVSDTA